MAKFLRWLLMLPGGDRKQGLREMEQARERGEVLRGEADYQLHLIYLWYEQKPGQARSLLESLDARYPSNPVFLRRIAEVEDDYFHNHFAAAAAWQKLLDRAENGSVAAPDMAGVRARLGAAIELDHLFETDRAVEALRALVNDRPPAPVDALSRANLLLAAACDRLGQRNEAAAAYSRAIATAPEGESGHVRDAARAGEARKPDATRASAYRLALEGWRAFERKAFDEAEAKFRASIAIAPDAPVTSYRYARLLEARGDRDAARDRFEKIIAAPQPAPSAVLASAYVECARLVERDGDRTRATTLYRAALDITTGDPVARDRASRALKRLATTRAIRKF